MGVVDVYRVIGDAGEVQTGVEVLQGMIHAGFIADLAAFTGHRRTDLGEGHGLYAARALEEHHGAGEQRRQLQEAMGDAVDTGVVGIEAGVVVQVDAGEHASRAHLLHDLRHDGVFRCRRQLAAGPDAIVIRLTLHAAYTVAGRGHVADEDRQAARQ